MSPRLTSNTRDRILTETPTNFVNELDSSNPAFSWLNSPHLLPLTPKRESTENQNNSRYDSATMPNFPSTFFPQDEIRRNNSKCNAGGRNIQNHHPYSSMICISPLASSRKQLRQDPNSKRDRS